MDKNPGISKLSCLLACWYGIIPPSCRYLSQESGVWDPLWINADTWVGGQFRSEMIICVVLIGKGRSNMTSLAVLTIPHLSIGEGTSHLASRLDTSGPHSFPTVTPFLVSLPCPAFYFWLQAKWQQLLNLPTIGQLLKLAEVDGESLLPPPVALKRTWALP